jgi:hypothetical protein
MSIETRRRSSEDGHTPHGRPETTTGYDYFTDAVPLRGDRETREREERMRRLDGARSRRRRPGRRVVVGIVLASAAIGAGALSLSARPTSGGAIDAGSPSGRAVRPPAAEPLTRPPVVGLGQAVAVAGPEPRRHKRESSHPRRRKHRMPSREEEAESARPPTAASEPEPVESSATTESETEPEAIVTPETEAEPAPPAEAPEPESSAPTASSTEGEATSSSSEANRQFGFGR